MTAEVALFTRIVDYAGTFPPAALPLDDAVRNYAAYLQSDDAWMLGRFVVSAGRLQALHPHRAAFDGAPARLSVLLATPDARAGYFEALSAEFARVRGFQEDAGGAFAAEAVEFSLPSRAVPADGEGRTDFLDRLTRLSEEHGFPSITTFIELPVPEQRAAAFEALVREMGRRQAADASGVRVAAKIRCGGPTASDVPSVAGLARAVHSFAKHRVPWKATAGLHHPFRHQRGRHEVMHGFVNLFVCAVLLHARKIAIPEAEALLADEDRERFMVSPEGVSWRGVRVSVEEVAAARTEFALSFGSCSFDDPRNDLRAAGILG